MKDEPEDEPDELERWLEDSLSHGNLKEEPEDEELERWLEDSLSQGNLWDEPDDDSDSSLKKLCEEPEELLELERGEAEDSLLLTNPGGQLWEEPLAKALPEDFPEENVINLGSCGTQSPLLEELEELEPAERELEEAEEAELQLPRTVEHGVGGKAKG